MRTPDAPPLVLENDGLATSLTFSRDGMRLASGSPDGLVRVWDLSRPAAPLASLQVRARLATSRGSPAAVVALSPDGARLAATSEIVNSSDPSVLVWDLSNMAAQPTAFRTGGDRPSAIAFSPDGERLAAGGTDKMVRVWNSRRPEVPGLSLRGHQDFVTALAFSPDGKRIASGSRDRTVRVWDITEDAEWQLLLPLKAPVPAFDLRAALDASFQPLAFSPDGARLASSDNDADVRIWDLRNSGTPPLVLQGHAGIVQPVAFSPDGSRLAAGGRDGSVQVWNLRNLQTRPMLLQGHAGAVVSVAFASDNTRLASAGADGTARIWDLRTARSTASTFYAALLPPSALPGGPSSLRGASFSSDLGRLVFAGLEPGGIPVRIWDLWSPRSAQTILPAPDTFQLASFVSFSPDGSRVAAGGTDFGVRLWNLRSPGSTPLTQDGLQGLGLSFSPDSSRLAFAKVSLTNDHLQLWDLRSPLEPPLVIPVFPNITSRPGPVDSVAFSPDGARLAILSRRTGQIAVWRLWSEAADYLCRQVWRNLTMDEWRQSVGDNIPYERTCPALPPGEGAPR
jgi:WD40 repeat protein